MSEWQPIESEPGDGAFRLYGLHVQNRDGYCWFEAYYLQVDDCSGDMLEPGGDIFSAWALTDFEVWAPAPSGPPAQTDKPPRSLTAA